MSSSPRLFLNENLIEEKELKITDKIFHYIINVMRCKVEDEIYLIDGKNGEFLSKIIFANNKYFTLKILKQTKKYESQPFLGLIFAPIQKIDLLLKSSTELGVTNFFPIKTDYTNKTNLKLNKIDGNIIEAVEQSERLDVPIVNKINNLKDVLNDITKQDSIIFFCEERSENLLNICNIKKDNKWLNKKIYALVGPEGGFSKSEKEFLLLNKNVISISLGKNILRTETATISIISILKMFLDSN